MSFWRSRLENLLFLLVLLVCGANSWDAAYVTGRIVVPVAHLTQELLYCVCQRCYDHRLDFMLQSVQQESLHPQLVLSTRADFELRRGNHKRNMYTVVLTDDVDDHVFEILESVLRGRHAYICMVVLYDPVGNFIVVERVLRRLFRNKFLNTVVYFRNVTSGLNEVFGFVYYPRFTIVNRTHWVEDGLSGFYRKLREPLNVHRYRFLSPVLQNAPGVVRYFRERRWRVGGTSYNILNMFVSFINGSLETYGEPSEGFANMRHILDMVRYGQIDLTTHAYALFESDNQIDTSYPLLVVNWCLMVPITNKVSPLFYPLSPFDGVVWVITLHAFALSLGVNYLRAHYQPCRCHTHTFLVTLCQFVNVSPPRALQPGSWLNAFSCTCSFANAFFLSAFYTSMLGSILTVTLFHTEINTLQDLIAAQLPVMVIDYELEFLMRRNFGMPQAFLNLLRPTSSEEFHRHQLKLNRSFAYFVTDDMWRILDLQQQYLRRRAFRLSEICFGAYHLTFPMEPDSPLWRELEYFLYRVHSSGLYFYFESKAFEYAIKAGLLQRLTDIYAYQTVGMQHLKIVFAVHFLNLLIAVLIFGVECFYYKITNKNLQKSKAKGRWNCAKAAHLNNNI